MITPSKGLGAPGPGAVEVYSAGAGSNRGRSSRVLSIVTAGGNAGGLQPGEIRQYGYVVLEQFIGRGEGAGAILPEHFKTDGPKQ